MAFDITIGNYYNAESIIHRLDPRVKISLMLLLFITAFIADSFTSLAAVLLLLLVVIALSAIPLPTVFKASLPLCLMLIFPLLFNLFFVSDGTPLLQWGLLQITSDGLYRALFMSLRLFMLFAAATLLTLTTSPIALCDAISAMLKPFTRFGLPAFEISMLLSIALRFLPMLMEDFNHIRKAQQARGAVFDHGGPIARVKALLPCLVPLFALSFRHAEELAMAMESRCYHGGEARTHYHLIHFANRDVAAIAACVLALTAVLLVKLAAPALP